MLPYLVFLKKAQYRTSLDIRDMSYSCKWFINAKNSKLSLYLPITMSPWRALVSATLVWRSSAREPKWLSNQCGGGLDMISDPVSDRTAEIITKSISLPGKKLPKWVLCLIQKNSKLRLHTAINRADFVSWWMWFNDSLTKVHRNFLTNAFCYLRTYITCTRIRNRPD